MLVLIITGAFVLILVLLLIRLKYDRAVEQIWRSFRSQSISLIFTEDMVADLDESVQPYFLHAIELGTSLASYVQLEMNGSFRLQPNVEWLTMLASQIISSSNSFVWQARIGKGLAKFSGADYYAQNQGWVKFSLWGLIPLVDAQDSNINRFSVGRLCIEYIWLPSVLLPQNGVVWQAVSDNIIQANFEVDNEPITLTLNIDRHGKLLNLSLPHWGEVTEDKNWQYITFGREVEAEKTFGGYTIPVQMHAGYWFGTDRYWAFFQATVEQAEFG